MTPRRMLKPMIAGLAILSLMLQACLVALQLSILIVPKAGAIDAALNVICTDHGAVVPPRRRRRVTGDPVADRVRYAGPLVSAVCPFCQAQPLTSCLPLVGPSISISITTCILRNF